MKFCEAEVLSTKGAGCAEVGLAPSKHFCFVTDAQTTCIHREYALQGRDCEIADYRDVREWRECSPGTPTFGAP